MARSGELPHHGSVLPYFRQVIAPRRALGRRPARGDARRPLRARALLRRRRLRPGDLGDRCREHMLGDTTAAPDDARRPPRPKQHFVISAGLYAASSGRATFGMGELKELLDSNDGGTASASTTWPPTPPAPASPPPSSPRRRRTGRRCSRASTTRHAVLPALDGLPTGLSDAEFRHRYGDVDSAAYAAMVERYSRPRRRAADLRRRACRLSRRARPAPQPPFAASQARRKAISSSCAAMTSRASSASSGFSPYSSCTRAMSIAP